MEESLPQKGATPAPSAHRLRRWGLRLLALIAAVLVATIATLAVLLHSLDRPWLKHRIQALAHDSAGLDLDYASVDVSVFSGIRIDGLVVRSPVEGRSLAPDLLRVGRIAARWSAGSLLGHGPRVEELTVSDVALTVLVDENGRTSFDALGPPAPGPPSPPTPLSRQPSALKAAPVVRKLAVDRVAVAILRTEAGKVVERDDLRGVALAMVFAPVPTEGWRVTGGLGSSAEPLDLQISRERSGVPAGDGRAKLFVTLDATASALSAALDLRVTDQRFAPDLPTTGAVHAEAIARFDPVAGRTAIELHHVQAIDRAATLEASMEVPDRGDAVVRHAKGDIDAARLLPWIPAGLVPVAAERAHLSYQIDGLVAGPVVRVSDGGGIVLDADLANVKANLSSGPVAVGSAKISLRAGPGPHGGIVGRGTAQLSGVDVDSGGARVAAGDLGVDLDGRQDADGSITGKLGVHSQNIERGGASPISARDLHVDVDAKSLVLGAPDPLTTRGDVVVSLRAASLDAGPVAATGVAVRVHSALTGQPLFAADATVTASKLRVTRRDGAPLVDAPLHLEAAAHDVVVPLAHPELSRGVGRASVELGESTLSVDATRKADSVDFDVQARAPSLGVARPFLPPALAREAPWDQMGLTLRSSGHVDRPLGPDPSIRHTTQLDLERPAFEQVGAGALSLSLESHGTALQHEAKLDLHARGLTVSGGEPHDEHVTLAASLDRSRPSFRIDLATEGRATSKLTASASFDPARRAVPYAVDGHFAGLAGLAPFLAKVHGLEGFDLSQLDVGVSARGAIVGVVAGVGRDGSVQLAAHPLRTGGLEGSAELRVGHLHWEHGDDAVISPAIAWHGDFDVAGEKRTVRSRLECEALHLDLGPHDVDLAGLRDDSTVTVTGDIEDPAAAIAQRATLRTLVQDYVAQYPTGDLSLAVTADRDRGGVIHVADLKLANGAGGSTLGLTGNVELGSGQRTLSMTTTLGQDLARLDRAPDRFAGRGKIAVEANVTSPDLALFRVHAALKGTDVTLKMPRAHFELDTANGEVPITLMLDVGKDGVALRREPGRSPYSMLRFADQHPLLSRSGYLSIASLKTPLVTIAPLVGNLAIEQSEISLRQFEMGVRNGSITGQLGLDWDGPKSTLELHVRASGVQSSHGEPFDGNIAVVVAAGDRTVEGRADILRIGERHLLDLLDMEDPLHVDPAMNRIRTALKVGYPDRLRLVFDHGFASARLELGGLARLISIGELRGIPMGPIVDKFLTPLLDTNASSSAN